MYVYILWTITLSAEHWTLLASSYYTCFMSHIELLYNYVNYRMSDTFEVVY